MKVQFVDLIVARLKTHPQAIRFLIKRGGGGGGESLVYTALPALHHFTESSVNHIAL